jgi:hypothetical protein
VVVFHDTNGDHMLNPGTGDAVVLIGRSLSDLDPTSMV